MVYPSHQGPLFPHARAGILATFPHKPQEYRDLKGVPQTLWGPAKLAIALSAVFSLPTPQPDKSGYGELGNC